MREVIYEGQGGVRAAFCTGVALSEQARAAIAAMARDIRLQMEIDDPDGLLGDRQQRAIDRLHKRQTPECGSQYGEHICTRPYGHTGRCVTACGTQRWEERMTDFCEAGGCIQVDDYYGTAIRLHSTQTGTTMQATVGEWLIFAAEVKAGDWDHIGQTPIEEGVPQ